MRKKVLLSVIAAFAVCAIFALLFVRLMFTAFASFECATRFCGEPTTAEARERLSRRVGEAVARYQRGIESRTEDFLVRRPEFQRCAATVSNALESCRMEMAGDGAAGGDVVNLRVTCGNAVLACALADFVVRDFGSWLERQALFSFEKNTAADRAVIERMSRQGAEPNSALLNRVETAKRIFEGDRLKVRPIDSARIESWELSSLCFRPIPRR